jgi:raffinose/stachyose/melibiose transport system permease protein
MKKKKTNLVKMLLSSLILFIHFVPFYILISVSFKKQMDLSSRWKLPGYLSLDNFSLALEKGNLIRAIANTMLITVITVFLIVAVGSMASYPLSRVERKSNKIILNVILAVMMIPPLSVLVPLYKTIVILKGINTYWGIILISTTYNLPISIFLFTNFIGTIPKALDEAAMIDGCSRISIFYRIILPALKPVTASVVILTGVYVWNDYSFQMYVLQKRNVRTVTLAIASFFTENAANLNAGAAAALLVIIPPIILYLIMQKYFIKGIADGAVKG